LESPKGFVEMFAPQANLEQAVQGWGTHFEMRLNAYKPYPSGIVVQPAIDTCLEVVEQMGASEKIEDVKLTVHPLALDLTGRRLPASPVEAQISLFHWAAASLLQREAGLAQLQQSCIDDPSVSALRARIQASADATLNRDEAILEVRLSDGKTLRSHVKHARGSVMRPMTDHELSDKFQAQARTVLSDSKVQQLHKLCFDLAELQDVGSEISKVWTD
jgi:2-methylcitrate dehydratase PrpD